MAEKKLKAREIVKINIRGINFIYKLIPWNYFLGFTLITIWILIDYWTYIFLAALVDNIINGAGREELIKNAIILVGGHTAIFVSHWILAHYYYYCGSNVWELANAQLNINTMNTLDKQRLLTAFVSYGCNVQSCYHLSPNTNYFELF